MSQTDRSGIHDAKDNSFDIAKIIEQELVFLRELLATFHALPSSDRPDVEEKLLEKKRAELQKKIRLLRIEKERFFEDFFYSSTDDISLQMQYDQLSAIKREIEKRNRQEKKPFKTPPIKKIAPPSLAQMKPAIMTLDPPLFSQQD
jgi:hypothetical protein